MQRPSSDHHPFRWTLGLLAITGGIAGLIGLYLVDLPANNQQPVLVGLGVILGWGSQVIASEFGSTFTGRKLAETAAEQLQRTADRDHGGNKK